MPVLVCGCFAAQVVPPRPAPAYFRQFPDQCWIGVLWARGEHRAGHYVGMSENKARAARDKHGVVRFTLPDGRLHNSEGPAVQYPDGKVEFWKEGQLMQIADTTPGEAVLIVTSYSDGSVKLESKVSPEQVAAILAQLTAMVTSHLAGYHDGEED